MNSAQTTLNSHSDQTFEGAIARRHHAGSREEQDPNDLGGPDVPSRRELLTPAQLADRWGVTTGYLANLRHQREGIGYLKIGSRIAYRFTDVLAFENEHYVSPS